MDMVEIHEHRDDQGRADIGIVDGADGSDTPICYGDHTIPNGSIWIASRA